MNFDFQKMLKQAQKLQEQMGDLQKDLEHVELTGTAGGGAVKVTSNARFEFKSVSIDPEALKDAGLLEEMLLMALQDLGQQIGKVAEDKMAQVTSGLKIPGLKIPGLG